MASKTEGMALLSMYNDEDDDDDDEAEEEHPAPPSPPPPPPATEEVVPVADEDQGAGGASEPRASPQPEDATPSAPQSISPAFLDDELECRTVRTPMSQLSSAFTPSPSPYSFPTPSPAPPPHFTLAHSSFTRSLEVGISNGSSLTIVDYGHDDVAMSPEHDDAVVACNGSVVVDTELQVVHVSEAILENGTSQQDIQKSSPITQQTTQTFNFSHQSNMESFLAMPSTGAVIETDNVEETIDVAAGVQVDPLASFFVHPPPAIKCSKDLQEKINKYLAYKRKGMNFNEDLRKRKEYRNPDFLQHAVQYQGIKSLGTCFSKDIFNPYGYDKSDYYGELEAAIERKEQERKKNQKIDFLSGGTHVGSVAAGLKMSSHIAAGLPAVPTSVMQVNPAVESLGRQTKKSKWDKVDGDIKNAMNVGGHDNLTTTGVNAAHMSNANAGAGYTAFAQQKRREAEEKKSSERRDEKRS